MRFWNACLDLLAPRRCPTCEEALSIEQLVFCTSCALLTEPEPIGPGAFVYGGPIADAVRRFKYEGEVALGAGLAMLMGDFVLHHHAGRVDAVIPVPLHPRRLRERGFDQAVALARPLARLLEVPLELSLLRRHRWTQPQASLPRASRPANVRGAFVARPNSGYRRILLVDDVYTTGATMDAAAQALATAGVDAVRRVTFARAET